jgi:hypothetical protein
VTVLFGVVPNGAGRITAVALSLLAPGFPSCLMRSPDIEPRSPLLRRVAHWNGGLALWAVVALVGIGAGFWLKWRLLLVPDPIEWFRFSWGTMAYSDIVGIYLRDRLWTHPIPYLQTRLEYPVVIGAVQYVASWAPGPGGYFLAMSALLSVAALGGLWAMVKIGPRPSLWIFAATPPLLLYGAINWDLLGILFLLLALLLFDRERDGWSALLLALGIWTKLFPGLLLPWMLATRARERRWRRLLLLVGVLLAVSLALNLPIYLASPDGWLYTLRFHSDRPPDGGSIWAYLPGLSVQWVDRWSLLLGVSGAVGAGAMALSSGRGVARPALVALACLFLTLKVTSPQYDLWIVPFLALAPVPAWLVALFVGADLAYCWASSQALYVAWGGHGMLGEMQLMVVRLGNWGHQLALLAVLLWAAGVVPSRSRRAGRP